MSSQGEVKPLGRLRFADNRDAGVIFNMVNENMRINFRVETEDDVDYLISTSTLTIVQMDEKQEVVGCMVLKDYPLAPSVHPQAWPDYIWTKFKCTEMTPRNSLFIHLLCWELQYGRLVVDRLLRSVFMHDQYVHHVAQLKMTQTHLFLNPDYSLSEGSFRRVSSHERGIAPARLPCLWIADRDAVCPRLKIRRAVEEDNDDIIPILHRHTPRLTELYGEFYVSELIARHPESDRVLLVCEHKELAVGVMCLNTQINYADLEEAYDLSPYAGLRKITGHPDKDDSSYNIMDKLPAVSQMNITDGSNSQMYMSHERRSGSGPAIQDIDDTEDEVADDGRQLSAVRYDYLNLFEDEEDVDFDIVNIDTNLLRVPVMITEGSDNFGISDFIVRSLPDSPTDSEGIITNRPKKHTIAGLDRLNSRVHTVRYTGAPNAFILELFAIQTGYDERYGFDMLEVAFELFPDRDYCIICLPSDNVAFPLLEHFTLVTPFSCKPKFLNQTLYVAHANSIRGNLRVRAGEPYDLCHIADILEHVPKSMPVFKLFQASLTANRLKSYVLLSENQPVGMVVLGPLDDSSIFRAKYTLNPTPHRQGTDGAILAGVVSPVFEPHARWLLREVIRHSMFSTLFWINRTCCKADTYPQSPERNLMSLASRMVHVRGRRATPNLTGLKELDVYFKDELYAPAVWMIDRPLCSVPKVDVNNNIVVVGASRTGIAFLEDLLMGPSSSYLTFTNVTLVSEHGLRHVAECLRAAETCAPRGGRYHERYLHSLPLSHYLDVVPSVMTKIDRQQKCIHLKSGAVKYYDTLVLTCGRQFQHPEYLKNYMDREKDAFKEKKCHHKQMGSAHYRPEQPPPSPELPDNVMLINSLCVANKCLKKLVRMISDLKNTNRCISPQNGIVVYGECIEAYSCMSALLELGLAADLISFVEPPADAWPRVNCFNDEIVDERVQDSIAKIGITVYRKYRLTKWNVLHHNVKSVTLMSHMKRFKLPCFALFYYGTKGLDINAFKAINECGLVYSGGVVINASCETNDPHILAAGPCTRYSRRLYAESRMHQYYYPEDVGAALAKLLLRRLDPFVLTNEDSDMHRSSSVIVGYSSSLILFLSSYFSVNKLPSDPTQSRGLQCWHPVPRFHSPVYVSATMPGPLYYMLVRKPGPIIPFEAAMALPYQGHSLETDKDGNYFRLKLDCLHAVQGVTCLSRQPFPAELWPRLYGRHEAFYHHVVYRFKANRIDDFYSYFTQPWMSALYQDSFELMLEDLNCYQLQTVYSRIRMFMTQIEKERKKCCEESKRAESIEHRHSDSSRRFTEPKNPSRFQSILDELPPALECKSESLPDEKDSFDKCGQHAKIRSAANEIWVEEDGSRVVMSEIAKYLEAHSLTNAHYAKPNPTLTFLPRL